MNTVVLVNRDAESGVHYGGPLELLLILEIQLGLMSPEDSETMRAVRLLGWLDVESAFWYESSQSDPFATALRLLRWNEELRLCGWNGEGVSPRLEQLAALMRDTTPGLSARIVRVIEALGAQRADLDSIELLSFHRSELPVLYRRLLDTLEASGCRITECELETAHGLGDIDGCLANGFDLSGPSELRMIRPQGPLAAAELVAAWLDLLDDLSGTVVIGNDGILDAALHRFGLPAPGAKRSAGSDPLLQILPLVIALSWPPQDPHLAQQLLSLVESPVPPGIASRLVRALRKWPSISSPDWREALKEGLDAIPDDDRHNRVQERLGVIFSATATGDEFPASGLDRRVAALEAWAKGMAKTPDADEDRWKSMLQQLAVFRRLYQASGLAGLGRHLVDRLVRAATEQSEPPPFREAEAGIFVVSEPGAILCPVRRVVWWNFTERSAPSVERLMLTPGEKEELTDSGCEFPETAVQAERLSREWRRPLRMAVESMLLVCPRFGADGEPEAPHPLWAEIASGLKPEQVGKLLGELPPGVTRNREVPGLAVPEPKRQWQVAPSVTIRPPEDFSPTSLETLLGNPLYWVLKYPGKLSYGISEPLSADVLLMGSLSHAIVGDLLAECVQKPLHDPLHACELAGRRFDMEGPSLAAGFFTPGMERERARLRHTVVDMTRDLFSHLLEAGATVAAVETAISWEIDGIRISGRPDLVLNNPAVVLDMKWGREGDRSKELEQGGALQLSMYAALLGRPHSIGYYISSRQRLLLCNPGRFDCLRVEGPTPDEIWDAARVILKERLEQLGECVVEDTCALVEGNTPARSSSLVEGRLMIAPKPERSVFGWISSGTAGS